jgi:hypothetical protein
VLDAAGIETLQQQMEQELHRLYRRAAEGL